MSYAGILQASPPLLLPGVATAVAKIACQPPDVWNDLTQQCIRKIGSIILADMPSICAQADATWDPTANACKPNAPTPSPSEGWGTTTWLLIGAGVLGAAVYLGRRKYKPNRTDFERLKDCHTEVVALRQALSSRS